LAIILLDNQNYVAFLLARLILLNPELIFQCLTAKSLANYDVHAWKAWWTLQVYNVGDVQRTSYATSQNRKNLKLCFSINIFLEYFWPLYFSCFPILDIILKYNQMVLVGSPEYVIDDLNKQHRRHTIKKMCECM